LNSAIFILILLLIIFINDWVKVSLFMWSTNLKGSSFKYTILYILSKKELKDLLNNK